LSEYTIKLRIVEINGFCPVFKLGDEFRMTAGYVLEGREQYCMHVISTILPYYIALSRGVSPASLGLCKEGENVAYVHCPDTGRSHTGGSVVVELSREE